MTSSDQAVAAIHSGDVAALRRLLATDPALATARVGAPGPDGLPCRTLLHVLTDWPGHHPGGAGTVAALVAAGADVNARFGTQPGGSDGVVTSPPGTDGGGTAPADGTAPAGSAGRTGSAPHAETPLHWAASTDDVAVLDALLDAGADLDAPGAVVAGGTPLADAVAFGQWNAARRLVERGARTELWQDAALGMLDRLRPRFAGPRASWPAPEEVSNAFWCACHGGQLTAAAYLLDKDADRNWPGHDGLTPLDAAERADAEDVVAWLRAAGGRRAAEPG